MMRFLRPKKMYAVVGDPDEIREVLTRHLKPQDRCEVRPGNWFVRSRRPTASEMAKRLGIGPKTSGLVITATYYSGYADSAVIEKLEGWEREAGDY